MTRRTNATAGYDYMGMGFTAWSLYLDAMSVIAMRSVKIMQGGAAGQREATLMVNEKIQSAVELGTAAMTGNLGNSSSETTQKVLGHYGRKVRANKKRLA